MLLIYLGLAVLVYIQFGAGRDPKRNRDLCIYIGAFLFLISAMKSTTFRSDLVMYTRSYENLQFYSYQELIEMWLNDELKDGIFYVFAKVFRDLDLSVEVWMGFIALLFAVGVAWFIYRNSAKPFLSLMLLMTLDYFWFSLSGLRQVMAMSIVLMFSYQAIIDRRPIRFLISVAVASLFHSSAVLFLPAYFIAAWKIGVKQVILVCGVLVVFFMFPNAIRWLLSQISWSESIAAYADRTEALTWSGVIIHLCIMVYSILFRRETVLNEYEQWRKVDVFVNCMIVGLCLQLFSTMIAEAFRMAYYYNMCCIAVVPNLVVENKRESNHSTMYLLLALCLVAYMLWSRAYSGMEYFWQS